MIFYIDYIISVYQKICCHLVNTVLHQSIGLRAVLETAEVSFSEIEIMSAETSAKLGVLYYVGWLYDFDRIDELSEATVVGDLTSLPTTIRDVANDGSNSDPAKV